MPASYSWPVLPAATPTPAPQMGILAGQDSAQAVADFGSDCLVFPEVDATFTLYSGQQMLADALARRLLTPRGKLSQHPSYGRDLRDYLNAAMTDARLFQVKSDVEAELEQDERVFSCDCTVSYSQELETLALSCAIETTEGPFEFVISLPNMNVQLVASQG